jgi:hypothetical protein
MTLQRQNFPRVIAFLLVTLTGAVALSAQAQSPAPKASQPDSRAQRTASIPALVPNLTGGIWAHPMVGFESPATGPGPVVNKARLPSGVSNQGLMLGDFAN